MTGTRLNVIGTRRDLLVCSAAVLGARRSWAAKSRLDKHSISAITDEIGRTQADAIAFAKHYALQWVELRNVPGSKKEFAFLSEPELKRYASELAANKLEVSLLKTSLLKFPWPELFPADPDLEVNRKLWDRRKNDMAAAIAAARILGAEKIRIFTGARLTNPEKAYPVVARTMEELAPLAESARVRLLIENEPSQNIGTCAELKAIMEMLPSKSIGFNWDPQNAIALNEILWLGYAQLPKSRILNVQIKGESLADGPASINKNDWRKLFEAIRKDGYQGEISVATETSDGTFEKATDAVREVLHIVGELA